jgi:ribosomal protein S18 acetylase RimI-like enzyme
MTGEFDYKRIDRDDGPEAQLIHEALRIEIESQVGPSKRQGLTLVFHSKSGDLQAGLRGFSHWQWLYISHLWVSPEARSKGLGAKLIVEAESEARKRGCLGLYVDTFDEGAASFYRRQGFNEVGRIENFPVGRARIFLSKAI